MKLESDRRKLEKKLVLIDAEMQLMKQCRDKDKNPGSNPGKFRSRAVTTKLFTIVRRLLTVNPRKKKSDLQLGRRQI
jgi:hypothetical protein